jgi:carbon storage regulator
MLMLVRKKNESIVIGENIIVTVTEIYDGTVRLGIDAPKEMAVHRREIYEAIKRGEVPKEEAAASDE